jgi:hypothetical protein
MSARRRGSSRSGPDSTLFWTVIPYAFQPAGMQSIFAGVPPEHVQAFGMDRKAFRGNAPRMAIPEAIGALQVYLQRLEGMLRDGRPYLLGALPTIADFSAYHSMWFIRRAGPLAAILDPHPRLQNWVEHVKKIGHGGERRTGERRCARHRAQTDRTHRSATCRSPIRTASPLGERVRVAATDYGSDPVEGELVVCAANELAVRRTDPRAGEVIVHFPRIGFQMTRAE